MGDWRYFTQRASTGIWLDTNTQLSDVSLSWVLSGPGNGQAAIPAGLNATALASDGHNVWGKWDTILYAEEDQKLMWVGICTSATPDKDGLHLEFVGTSGWFQRVPFERDYNVWRTNVFDVVRMIVAHAETHKPALTHILPAMDSVFFVGDTQPPPKPREPPRLKGETVSEWHGSPRYNNYQKARDDWNDKYGDRDQFSIAWFEAPYCGEEIDSLAREAPFEYRERYEWGNRANLVPRFYFDIDDIMVNRRTDIAFIDGINLAAALDPKDGDETYANRVIALGAGEGRTMLKVTAGGDDGRLYQAIFSNYKSVRNLTRLRNLAEADHRVYNSKDPKIGSATVWDVPGFADLSTLMVGDEVQVKSPNYQPAIDAWCRITGITREPKKSTVTVILETF